MQPAKSRDTKEMKSRKQQHEPTGRMNGAKMAEVDEEDSMDRKDDAKQQKLLKS